VIFGPPKTDAGVRSVHLDKVAMAEVVEHLTGLRPSPTRRCSRHARVGDREEGLGRSPRAILACCS
jgi:hypothetical protein